MFVDPLLLCRSPGNSSILGGVPSCERGKVRGEVVGVDEVRSHQRIISDTKALAVILRAVGVIRDFKKKVLAFVFLEGEVIGGHIH